MKDFNVVIVGRPNVGKSSLFNRIIKKRKALVHGKAGTTRDIVSEEVGVDDKLFILHDTAGYFEKTGDVIEKKALGKIKESIEFADLFVLVVSGKVAPTNEDKKIAKIVRKTGKDVIFVINKIDSSNNGSIIEEYKKMGFADIFTTSTIHNIGISDLVYEIAKRSKKGTKGEKEKTEPVKIAILGRPNVGKSSILNVMSGKEKAIVSEIAGTTRDVITENIEIDGSSFKVSDTAGTRKPGKIGRAYKAGEPIERFASLRTRKEIEKSDIVLMVLDASEKRATTQDLHIAGYAKDQGKGIILVVNKWDLVDEITQEAFLNRLRNRFGFMLWVPTIFVSAKTGKNIEKIPEIVEMVSENQNRRIPTAKLNRLLEDFSLYNLPKGAKKLRPKLFYASQIETKPPTISITAKNSKVIHFSWRRAFENELRRHYDFTGTPVKIEFKRK